MECHKIKDKSDLYHPRSCFVECRLPDLYFEKVTLKYYLFYNFFASLEANISIIICVLILLN